MSVSAQAPTREAALSLMLRQGELTAAQLAEALQVSVQVMRRHLRSLEAVSYTHLRAHET